MILISVSIYNKLTMLIFEQKVIILVTALQIYNTGPKIFLSKQYQSDIFFWIDAVTISAATVGINFTKATLGNSYDETFRIQYVCLQMTKEADEYRIRYAGRVYLQAVKFKLNVLSSV